MRIVAPAKLNRFLAVLGRREDGFHELMLVTTVLEGVLDLADQLEGEMAPGFSLELYGPTSDGLVPDESNLVMKAWRLLEKEAGRALPAKLRLEKRIPHGAGLGGGSSDAAATLKLGNALFQLDFSQSRLLEMGAELGSDVPLFLLGGTVLGLGRGERVFPLRTVPLEPILLVYPGHHVPTPSVFGALARAGYPPVAPCPSLPEGIAPPWQNDLTDAALLLCPVLDEVRKSLLDLGGEPLLCGSGSCWAARFHEVKARTEAKTRIQVDHKDWRCWEV